MPELTNRSTVQWAPQFRGGTRPTRTLAERLWFRVEKLPSGCWEWRGFINKRGYGEIGRGRLGDGSVTTHRAAWELTYGPIPKDLFVCHTCDNRICCNPDHLFLGTPADNSADMAAKGRAHRARGMTSANAKLTDDQVDQIRERWRPGTLAKLRTGHSSPELAAEFGVSRKYIIKLASGKRRSFQ